VPRKEDVVLGLGCWCDTTEQCGAVADITQLVCVCTTGNSMESMLLCGDVNLMQALVVQIVTARDT
jgi:hypothetical protein